MVCLKTPIKSDSKFYSFNFLHTIIIYLYIRTLNPVCYNKTFVHNYLSILNVVRIVNKFSYWDFTMVLYTNISGLLNDRILSWIIVPNNLSTYRFLFTHARFSATASIFFKLITPQSIIHSILMTTNQMYKCHVFIN